METVGKFEFSRKDLIGHGAFAVVFKGRNREKHDWEVAVKWINKNNLPKSQSLSRKEIKILKELKHENIVALHDFQYCNGGDLADYLHSKGTLSEDTIRVFLQQIAGAMRVLQAKGIIHRDLKPQNILLSHPAGRKTHSNNTCIKIADFGFARHLQNNMMAATLCGSPMYMAPEVIMSQNYDAKADLWSIGTIVFQCLTGKAPFQASSPQDLRLFYEKNKNLNCVSFSLSHSVSINLQQSLGEIQQIRAKALASPTQDSPGYLLKDSGGGGSSSKNSSCDTDDFVMVPAHFPSKSSLLASGSQGSQAKTPPRSPSYSSSPGPAGPIEYSVSNYGNYGQSVPIPVPTQIHNYQRMEQNLHSPSQDSSPRCGPMRRCSSGSPLSYGRTGPSPPHPAAPPSRRLSMGGSKPFQLSPQGENLIYFSQFTQDLSLLSFTAALQIPEAKARPQQQQQQGLGSRLHSAPCLLEAAGGCRQTIRKQHSDPVVAPQGGTLALRPLHSSPRLSELMQRSPLPTILGSPSRVCGHSPSGGGTMVVGSGSPARVVFTVGSPPRGGTPPQTSRCRKFSAGSSSSISPVGSLTSRYPHSGMCLDGYEGPSSPRYGLTGHISANIEGAVTFEAPELPEETLMEQEHTETLHRLRFTLDFARCMVEVAAARGGEAERAEPAPTCLHEQQSMVADQISSLSREWGYAEQLVLYMKTAELLSSALHTAMEGIKQGKLYPSSTVKQVVRRLNDLYKSSVMSCRSLSARLERFFSRKHRLMDHINSITAERLIFSHTVQMVQAAALDEMFHQGEASVQRYHKALLLMEGLSLLLTEQADLLNVSKCKYKHPYRKHLQQGSSNPVY
uniref:non-specific serine/threonine protein kinase n=1 Tax=Astyanax mexicanus TaxID=7994 RepID=A0A8B9HAI6_ASTMX